MPPNSATANPRRDREESTEACGSVERSFCRKVRSKPQTGSNRNKYISASRFCEQLAETKAARPFSGPGMAGMEWQKLSDSSVRVDVSRVRGRSRARVGQISTSGVRLSAVGATLAPRGYSLMPRRCRTIGISLERVDWLAIDVVRGTNSGHNNEGRSPDCSTPIHLEPCPGARQCRHGRYLFWSRTSNGATSPWDSKRWLDAATR